MQPQTFVPHWESLWRMELLGQGGQGDPSFLHMCNCCFLNTSSYLICTSGRSSFPAPAWKMRPEAVALFLLSPPSSGSRRLHRSSCTEAWTRPSAASAEDVAVCRGSTAPLSSCSLGFPHWLLPAVAPEPPPPPSPPASSQDALSFSPPAV